MQQQIPLKAKQDLQKILQRKKPTTKGNLWKAVIGTYRNHLTTLLRIAKDEYYKTHLKENKKDLETIWETIKKL